jgi:hypothetical protein
MSKFIGSKKIIGGVRFNLVYLYYGKRDDIKIFCNHSSPSIAELKDKRYLF